MSNDKIDIGSVVVIGTGLVGTSIALRLSEKGIIVHLQDRVASHALIAAGLGAGSVDIPNTNEIKLVIIATPPNSIAGVVKDSLKRYPNAIITDVGSVKTSILASLASTQISRYVGSHPMAGSQITGPLTAEAKLFEDRTWVITPHKDNSKTAINMVYQLAEICGSRVIEMTPTQHDDAVAQISHFPHLMSILTAEHLRNIPEKHRQLAGQGVRDVTRIARSDPKLWQQILYANREAVRKELLETKHDLDTLLNVLDNREDLEQFLAKGRDGARLLPGKHGKKSEDYAQVQIEIPDEPNALARLFTKMENMNINIEDIHIEHDEVREVGLLVIDIAPALAQNFGNYLAERGWKVKVSKEPGMESQLIAIDGPSGSGKSSAARAVAKKLGLAYLDTGSMYRAVAWAFLNSKIAENDELAVANLTRQLSLSVGTDPNNPSVSVNQVDITRDIRQPLISKNVSIVAKNLSVRNILTTQMRRIIENNDRRIVVEGRDITTIVAPDADLRILLTADSQARINRRKAELGAAVSDDEVQDQVIRRDKDDSTVAEFEQAADGVTVIDSTELTLDQVIEKIISLVR